jgi:signal transduction histidine kinase
MVFHRPISGTPPIVGLFVAAYLGSNILAGYLLPRLASSRIFETCVVLFDAIAVSTALLLTQEATSDFFLLYFVVMFIGSLTDRLGVVIATAFVISGLHLYTLARMGGTENLFTAAYLLRLPFLFAVALFFGYFVQRTRNAEHRAKKAVEQERLRSDFVAGVIHDLKNPLGVIQLMSERLLDEKSGDPLTEDQSDLIRRIHANSHQMMRLSLNLLNASQIEAGRLTLRPERTRLNEVTDEALAVSRTASDLKGVAVELLADAGLPDVEIDVIQMQRAVWNLLDNAIRHTPSGGRVVVQLGREDGRVSLCVSDNGPGIPEDELPTLFEKYKRNRQNRFSSTGLGLFIVRAIVEAHRGTVEARNRPEGGTTFCIRLPVSVRERTGDPRPAPARHPLPAVA